MLISRALGQVLALSASDVVMLCLTGPQPQSTAKPKRAARSTPTRSRNKRDAGAKGHSNAQAVTVENAWRACSAAFQRSQFSTERSFPGFMSPKGSTSLRKTIFRPSGSKRPPSSSLEICGLLRMHPSSSNDRMIAFKRASVV